MEDFIVIYTSPYKGYFEEKSKKYNKIGKKGLAYVLSEFLENTEASMLFSGIDYNGIREYIKEIKSDRFEDSIEGLKLRRISSEFSPRKELNEVAETYGLFYLLKLYGESAFPSRDEVSGYINSTPTFENYERKEGIGLMLRFDGWVVIKKLSYEDAEDYMVAGIVSGISDSISKKFYTLLGFDEVKKRKKSVKNLFESLKESMKKQGIERNYYIYKAFIENGYSPYATLEMLSKAYPTLKPKKPRGRMPKG